MSSLRRDLFERRLWPVVLVLVAAIVAVPVLMSRGGAASVSAPIAAAPTGRASSSAHGPTARRGGPVAGRQVSPNTTRDPFGSGVATGSPLRSPAATSSPSTSTGTVSTVTVTTTVPSSETVSTGSGSPLSQPTGSSTTHHSHRTTSRSSSPGGASTPVTFHVPGTKSVPAPTKITGSQSTKVSSHHTTPVTSPVAVTHTPTKTSSEAPSTWTIFGADMSYGVVGKVVNVIDLKRLTPLPSVSRPEMEFDGVTADGKWAVFQLALGVQVAGPAWCRPSVTMCTSIMLPIHGVEALTYTPTGGQASTFYLKLNRVTSERTHSSKAAAAAAKRQSAAGACELAMAGSATFDPSSLTASAPKPTRQCRRDHELVPFLGIGS